MPLNRVYIGPKAAETIESIAKDIGYYPDIKMFYSHCRHFLIECVQLIQTKFDQIDKSEFLYCLRPEVAYNLLVPSLSTVYQQLPYLQEIADLSDVDREWRQHAMSPNLHEKMTSHLYWQTVFKEKNPVGLQTHPNLCKVVAVLFSLPFSNAAVERVFSQLKLIKSDHRASLKQESLLGLVTTKISFQREGPLQAATLNPTKDMLQLHASMTAHADDEESAAIGESFSLN